MTAEVEARLNAFLMVFDRLDEELWQEKDVLVMKGENGHETKNAYRRPSNNIG